MFYVYTKLMIIAITGTPGSGKTTLAEYLHIHVPGSVLFSMDIFQINMALDDSELKNYFYLQVKRMMAELSEQGKTVLFEFAPTRRLGDFFDNRDDLFLYWLDISKDEAIARGLNRPKAKNYGSQQLGQDFDHAMKGVHANKPLHVLNAMKRVEDLAAEIAGLHGLSLVEDQNRAILAN